MYAPTGHDMLADAIIEMRDGSNRRKKGERIHEILS